MYLYLPPRYIHIPHSYIPGVATLASLPHKHLLSTPPSHTRHCIHTGPVPIKSTCPNGHTITRQGAAPAQAAPPRCALPPRDGGRPAQTPRHQIPWRAARVICAPTSERARACRLLPGREDGRYPPAAVPDADAGRYGPLGRDAVSHRPQE